MGDSSISVDNESSGESKYAFSDELLVALERSGKSLAEIGAIILPLEGSDPPSISVNGQEVSPYVCSVTAIE